MISEEERNKRAYIRRDPFGRWTLTRALVPTRETCHNCGMRRQSGRMFRYIVERDGGREDADIHVFCSIQCYDSYHF